jgi:formamidopyrimidine-DNA glycosylase
MIELPEAFNLAKQLKEAIRGKKIKSVITAYSPHKFAWYHGDPGDNDIRLRGKTAGAAEAHSGLVEIPFEDTALIFGDGVNLKFHDKDEKRASKHQLLVEFEGGTALSASVQMYGGLWCVKPDEYDNPYYRAAKTKPSPLSAEFDAAYFAQIIIAPDVQKLSAKALLATGQRIPGLGNGVLQDILFNAGIHPKRKVSAFSDNEKEQLFQSVKSTLKEMAEKGGRDTERDLYGNPGGYKTKLSQLTMGKPCAACGGYPVKQPYMGGSIYFCPSCQTL